MWNINIWYGALFVALHWAMGDALYMSATFNTSIPPLPIEDAVCYNMTDDGRVYNELSCAIHCHRGDCYGMRWNDDVCTICMLPPRGATPQTPPTDLIHKHGKI